jgi:excisionase family DNA binding protein
MKKYLSTLETAQILGLSRMHITRLIKSGKIKAVKVGRSYQIDSDSLGLEDSSSDNIIEQGVDRAVKEYGETLKKLGDE